jgi:hypothetical protein
MPARNHGIGQHQVVIRSPAYSKSLIGEPLLFNELAAVGYLQNGRLNCPSVCLSHGFFLKLILTDAACMSYPSVLVQEN